MINAQPYIGYYNMTAQGPYTGRVFDDGISQELYKLEYVNSTAAQTYLDLIDGSGYIPDLEFDDPIGVYIKPISDDYQRGYVTRYFIQQRNDNSARIREINKEQFLNLLDPGAGLNSNFYKGIALRWKITGVLNDITKNSVIIQPGIEDTNKRTIERKEFDMPGIKRYLQLRLTQHSEYDMQHNNKNTDIEL